MSRITDAKVAKRYARALFSIGNKAGKVDAVQRDLASISTVYSQSPELQRVLESPLVTADRKREIIDQVFKTDIDDLTRHFLHLLVDKRREEILPTVGEEFVILADNSRGLVRAQAYVAAPLDDLQRAAFLENLERRTGKTVELTVIEDPNIIGGAVVRMQDKVIDGSVRGALERIREDLLRER